MLTNLLIFAGLGTLVFAGSAHMLRRRAMNHPMSKILAFALAVATYFMCWVLGLFFGLWLYLDVMQGGVAGDVMGSLSQGGIIWSFVPAMLVYRKLTSVDNVEIVKQPN